MKKLFTFMFVLVIGFVLVGCQPEEKGTRQGITDTEIIVGNTAAISGGYESIGVPFNTALKAVFEQYNATTEGRKIVFKHFDDKFVGSTGLALTKQLVEEEKVFALVGHFGTETVNASMDYLLESGVPMVYGVTGVNSMYFEKEPGNNILAVQPIYKTEGRVLLARVLHESLFGANKNEKLPADKKIVVLYSEDDAGISIKDGISLEATNQNAASRMEYLPFSASTANSVVTTAMSQNPGAIIIAANQVPTIAAATALRQQLNLTPVFTSYVNGIGSFTPAQEVKEVEVTAADGTVTKTNVAQPLPYDVFANAWVDIVDATKPGPTAEMIGGDGKLVGWPYEMNDPLSQLLLGGFTNEYWTGFVATMNSSTVEGAKALWANAYAMAGYVAAHTFLSILDRVDLDTVTWESFIAAAESAPIKLPMAGTINWANGDRIGLDALALNKITYPVSGATFSKVIAVENLETINKK